MRKCILFILLVSALSFYSCGVDADQMLMNFNKGIFEDVGGGDYITEDAGPSFSGTLIAKNTYRVMEQSSIRIEVDSNFRSYDWSLIDNTTGKVQRVSTEYYLDLETITYGLKKGGDYTLNLVVENIDFVKFTDNAKIIVTENIYL